VGIHREGKRDNYHSRGEGAGLKGIKANNGNYDDDSGGKKPWGAGHMTAEESTN